MKYQVMRIEEDLDFGCEERGADEPVMAVVVLKDENGTESRIRQEDQMLYDWNIEEGDTVILNENGELRKVLSGDWTQNCNSKNVDTTKFVNMMQVVKAGKQILKPGLLAVDQLQAEAVVADGDAAADDELRQRDHPGHGEKHAQRVAQGLGIVLFHQGVDRVAAGGDDDLLPALRDDFFVFGLDDGRTYGGLLYSVKAKLFERRTHRFDGSARVICYKGWRKADCHGTFTLDEHLRNRYVISDFFCVLRTYDKALTAENALVFYDMRLAGLKTNGLDRAMTDALITVLTVRLFELQVVWHTLLSSL